MFQCTYALYMYEESYFHREKLHVQNEQRPFNQYYRQIAIQSIYCFIFALKYIQFGWQLKKDSNR